VKQSARGIRLPLQTPVSAARAVELHPTLVVPIPFELLCPIWRRSFRRSQKCFQGSWADHSHYQKKLSATAFACETPDGCGVNWRGVVAPNQSPADGYKTETAFWFPDDPVSGQAGNLGRRTIFLLTVNS
jgi:hypothetical protein